MNAHAETESQAPGVGAWLLRNALLVLVGVHPVLLLVWWAATGPTTSAPFDFVVYFYLVLFPLLLILTILYVPLAMVVAREAGWRGRLVVIAMGIVAAAGVAPAFSVDLREWLRISLLMTAAVTAMGLVVTLSPSERLGWRRWLFVPFPVLIAGAGMRAAGLL